jgi:hypothetical protein
MELKAIIPTRERTSPKVFASASDRWGSAKLVTLNYGGVASFHAPEGSSLMALMVRVATISGGSALSESGRRHGSWDRA